LLKVAPEAADAYLGLGTANYIIGSLPGTRRLFLGFAGIHGDKKKGIEQLETAAKYGHYLRPFAKILLALTALREKTPEVARAQLTELVAEFPENSLFASELAKPISEDSESSAIDSKSRNSDLVTTPNRNAMFLDTRICFSIENRLAPQHELLYFTVVQDNNYKNIGRVTIVSAAASRSWKSCNWGIAADYGCGQVSPL
jgi:hypothetical protein